MTQYQLCVYDTGEAPPPDDVIEQMHADVNAVNEEMRQAGAWVFGGGLQPASTATVVQARDGEMLLTDGPFTEGKEHVGGYWVIEAADLDAALDWARKATVACRAPVEVRPFQSES